MPLGCLLIGSVLPLWVLFSLFMNFPFNQKKKKNLTIITCINVGEFFKFFFRRDVCKLSGAIILHQIFNGNPTQN